MAWIEQLNEVDIEGVEPMTSAVEGLSLPMRDDVVTAARRAIAHRGIHYLAALGHHDQPARLPCREQVAQLTQRGVAADHVHARAHHAAHRRMAEAVAHGPVEVLARDDAGQVAVLGHLDAAQAETLALGERGGDHVRAGDRVHGP